MLSKCCLKLVASIEFQFFIVYYQLFVSNICIIYEDLLFLLILYFVELFNQNTVLIIVTHVIRVGSVKNNCMAS